MPKLKKKIEPRKKNSKAVGQGLSGFVVIWRHTMDDVPVGLFRTKAAAIKAANKTSFRAGYATARKLDLDCTTPVCFAVVEFDNGKAKEMIAVDRDDDAMRVITRSYAQQILRAQRKRQHAVRRSKRR